MIKNTPVILPQHLCFGELKCFHNVNSFTFSELKGETGWQTVSLFNVQELMKGRGTEDAKQELFGFITSVTSQLRKSLHFK